MELEVKFKTEKYNYYNRAVGVIGQHNKFLIMKVDNSPYYHLPGGHIEIGEDSLSAVKREIKEELDFDCIKANLFCIQENFYEKKGVAHHGVEYYYLIEIEENVETINKEIEENDRGVAKHLSVRWVDLQELKETDLRPKTLKESIINTALDSLVHIIQRD